MQNIEIGFANYLETSETDESFDHFQTAIKKAFIAGFNCANAQNLSTTALFKSQENHLKKAVTTL